MALTSAVHDVSEQRLTLVDPQVEANSKIKRTEPRTVRSTRKRVSQVHRRGQITDDMMGHNTQDVRSVCELWQKVNETFEAASTSGHTVVNFMATRGSPGVCLRFRRGEVHQNTRIYIYGTVFAPEVTRGVAAPIKVQPPSSTRGDALLGFGGSATPARVGNAAEGARLVGSVPRSLIRSRLNGVALAVVAV